MTVATVGPLVLGRPSIRLRFPDRTYLVTDLTQLLIGLDDLWRSSCRLAHWEQLLDTDSPSLRPPGHELPQWWAGDRSARLGRMIREGAAFAPPPFAVRSLALASPLHLEIEWVQGIGAGVGLLLGHRTTAFFVRAVRDPDRLGAWLPRVVDAWRRHWIDAEVSARRRALLKDATDEEIMRLFAAAQQLRDQGMLPEAVADLARTDGADRDAVVAPDHEIAQLPSPRPPEVVDVRRPPDPVIPPPAHGDRS